MIDYEGVTASMKSEFTLAHITAHSDATRTNFQELPNKCWFINHYNIHEVFIYDKNHKKILLI